MAKTTKRRRVRRMPWTWLIPPPAETITPAMARRWLYRSYPALSSLGSLGALESAFDYRGVGLRSEEREWARKGCRLLALDVRRIATVCGAVVATRKPRRIRFEPRVLGDHRGIARELRAMLKYERKHPHRGTRALLRRALAERTALLGGQ